MLNYQRVCDIHGSQNSSEATSNHSFALPGTHTDSKLSKAHLKERTWRGGKNCVIAPTQGLLQASLFQGTVVAQPFPRPVDSSRAGAWGQPFFKALLSHSLFQGPLTLRRPEPGASLFQGTVVAQPFPRPVDSSQAGAWGQPFFKARLSHSLFQGPLTLRRPEPGASLFSRHGCRTAFSKARWLFAGRSLGPSAGQPFSRHGCRTAFSKARWLFAGRSLGPAFFKARLSHSLFQGPLTLRRPEPGAFCRPAFFKALLSHSLFQGPLTLRRQEPVAFCKPAFFKARWTFAGRSLGPSAGQPFLRHLFDPAARSSQPQMETILNLLQSWKANPVPTEFACKMLYRLELVESDSAVIIRIILQLFPCYLWLPPMISCYFTVMFHSCWLF